MSAWKTIKNKEDVENLMSFFQNFHDACILSVQYRSGNRIIDNGSMVFPEKREVIAALIVQSQFQRKKIELEFTGVYRLHLIGFCENCCNGLIDCASFVFIENYKSSPYALPQRAIAWVDYGTEDDDSVVSFEILEGDEEDIEFLDGSYIIASSIRWRSLD